MTHPLNQFFDKVYFITIKRNEHRLSAFLERNKDLKVDFFHGVDGKLLFPEIEFVAGFPSSFFEEQGLDYERCAGWNKGQLGCAMSNLQVQKRIVADRVRSALILEDDALIIENRILQFQAAIQELPQDWELFYLGFNPTSVWSEHPFTRFFLRIKHIIKPTYTEGCLSSGNLSKRYFPETYSRYLNRPGVYGGTHAYALSFEGAKKIIALDSPLKYGFDTSLMYASYHDLINGYSLKQPFIMPNMQFATSLIN